MKDGISISGVYTIHDITNDIITIKHNLIMSAMKTLILQFLNYSEEGSPPAADGLDINYIAYGDDDTAANVADTALGNELFRKTLTDKSRSGNYLDIVGQLATTEANFNIKEIGLYVGGTASTDSGTLVSHIIVDISKNSNIEYNIYYRLELI